MFLFRHESILTYSPRPCNNLFKKLERRERTQDLQRNFTGSGESWRFGAARIGKNKTADATRDTIANFIFAQVEAVGKGNFPRGWGLYQYLCPCLWISLLGTLAGVDLNQNAKMHTEVQGSIYKPFKRLGWNGIPWGTNEKFDLSNNTRKHRKLRIERIAKIKETRRRKCTCRVDLPSSAQCTPSHPETRVCLFAVPIVLSLTLQMINGHTFGKNIW